MPSGEKEELASTNPGLKSLWRMLAEVKGAMRFWPTILQFKIKQGKSSFAKSIQNRVIYIIYFITSSHMKD
jgi:hypothetical protein